jgi:hypothetical protein
VLGERLRGLGVQQRFLLVVTLLAHLRKHYFTQIKTLRMFWMQQIGVKLASVGSGRFGS